MPDGVGDDLLAYLWTEIRDHETPAIPFEQICVAIDDVAFLSFPGELFTEIGMQIKRESPFRHTCIIGCAMAWSASSHAQSHLRRKLWGARPAGGRCGGGVGPRQQSEPASPRPRAMRVTEQANPKLRVLR